MDTGSPETFTCHKNIPNPNADREDFCNSLVYSNHPSDSVPAVEYYVPKSVIPYGDNQFAINGGFDNTLYQSLHGAWGLTPGQGGAETTYDKGGSSDDWDCDACHSKSTWDSKGMQGLSGYENDNPSNFIDAWTVANATGRGNSKVKDTTTGVLNDSHAPYPKSGNDALFPGGFAGNCPDKTKWQYFDPDDTGPMKPIWGCSGALNGWEQPTFFPVIDDSGGSNTAGMFIYPYVFSDSYNTPDNSYSFSYQYLNVRGSSESLHNLSAVCWNDELSNKPASFNAGDRGTKWFAVQAEGLPGNPSVPVPVYGNLDLDSSKAFSCEWQYWDTNSPSERWHMSGSVKVNTNGDQGTLENGWMTAGVTSTSEFDSGNTVSPGDLKTLYDDWRNNQLTFVSYDNSAPVSANLK